MRSNFEEDLVSKVETKIVGILLLRNEDLYVERVVANIIEFCDEIIVADNLSTDNTADIILTLQKQFPKIQYFQVDHPSKSHELITRFANTPTWIFAVDGDELYDAGGLSVLREKILDGDFNDSWLISGNVLNCIELDVHSGKAAGYLAPPCRSMTKLYNFDLIVAWSGDCPERLHGGEVVFKEGANEKQRLELHEEMSWEDSFFRCLHLCFLRRSSKEKDGGEGIVIRKNISDKNSEGIMRKILAAGAALFGPQQKSAWKNEKYMRGELVQKDVSSIVIDV